MSQFQKVAKVSEIKEGQMKKMAVGDKTFLIANVGGKFYAMGNICTHEQCHLDEGELEVATLTCPCHFAQFDVHSGKVLRGPNYTPPDTIEPEPTFEVKIEGEDILLAID